MGLKKFFNALCGVDNRNAAGETPLYKAAREGNVAQVRHLLKKGADPNIKTRRNLTPLHMAAYWGEATILDLLLEHKADPNIDNGKGWTPLHSAALAGGEKARKPVIDRLRKAGANDNIKDKNGWTAADYMALWTRDEKAAQKMREMTEAQGSNPLWKKPQQPCGPCAPKH